MVHDQASQPLSCLVKMLLTSHVCAGGKAPRQARPGLAPACQQGASKTLMQAVVALLQVSLWAGCSYACLLATP